MSALATALQRYFTDYAVNQRDLSPHTIAAYRDTWRLLLKHTAAALNITADKVDLAMLDAPLVSEFLDDLQSSRGNSATTRTARLTAIRAVLASPCRTIPSTPPRSHAC